jgi:hypothetical protein
MLLQQGVFATIAPVRIWVCQVLAAVKLNHQTCVRAQQVHLHLSPAIEGNRQLGIQTKSTCRLG